MLPKSAVGSKIFQNLLELGEKFHLSVGKKSGKKPDQRVLRVLTCPVLRFFFNFDTNYMGRSIERTPTQAK